MHLKTAHPDTVLAFLRYNLSCQELRLTCPNEGKSKFTDAFIQTVASFRGILPILRKLSFGSKFPFGFASAQRLIECLRDLEFIGPMEMFTKISPLDIGDLVTWVREHNWHVVLGYKNAEFNVFNLDQSEPWRHKFVPDVGRTPPVKAAKAVYKRTLSVHTGYTDDEGGDEALSGGSSDGRKRSKTATSSIFPPTECSARKSGSVISLKKMANGSNRTSVNMDNNNEEFEFEFAMDSDGFIKNKDYRLYNYQTKTMADLEAEDEYDEYDEYDEDTMDVEDLPEDAEFEWCWDDAGNLKIYEIADKVADSKQAEPEQVVMGAGLDRDEKDRLAWTETEVAFPFQGCGADHGEKTLQPPVLIDAKVEAKPLLEVNPHNVRILDLLPEPEPPVNLAAEAVGQGLVQASDNTSECESKSRTRSKSATRSRSRGTGTAAVPLDENGDASCSSSRRAKKRTAQITPPPAQEDKNVAKSTNDTALRQAPWSSASVPVVPLKTAKADTTEVPRKTGKIASIFERQPVANNNGFALGEENSKSRRNKKTTTTTVGNSSIKRNATETNNNNNTRKANTTASASPVSAVLSNPPPRTQVVEVFEFDPLLGYCTVKRKTIPIDSTTAAAEATAAPAAGSSSVNLSFLHSTLNSASSDVTSADDVLAPAQAASKEPQNISKNQSNLLSDSGHVEESEEVTKENMSSSLTATPTSNSSSAKENKVPNLQQAGSGSGGGSARPPLASRALGEVAALSPEKKSVNTPTSHAATSSTPAITATSAAKAQPMIPLSSINKYDIPFLGQLLAANMTKSAPPASIPEPPRCKPPSLPASVGHALPLLPVLLVAKPFPSSNNGSNSPGEIVAAATTMDSKTTEHYEVEESLTGHDAKGAVIVQNTGTAKTDITVPVSPVKAEVDKNSEVTVTVEQMPATATVPATANSSTKPVSGSANKSGGEKEWYWDYEDNCWKECDPDEDYEWEYIESDDDNNDGNNNKHHQTTALATVETTGAVTLLNKRSSSLQSLKEEAVASCSNSTNNNNNSNKGLGAVGVATGGSDKSTVEPDRRNHASKCKTGSIHRQFA